MRGSDRSCGPLACNVFISHILISVVTIGKLAGTWKGTRRSTNDPVEHYQTCFAKSDTILVCTDRYNLVKSMTWDGLTTLTFLAHTGSYDGDRTIVWDYGDTWTKQGTRNNICGTKLIKFN